MLNKILHTLCAFATMTTLAIEANAWKCVCGFTGVSATDSRICKGVGDTSTREYCDGFCNMKVGWGTTKTPLEEIGFDYKGGGGFFTRAEYQIKNVLFKNTNHFYEGYGNPVEQCQKWCKEGKCVNESWDEASLNDGGKF